MGLRITQVVGGSTKLYTIIDKIDPRVIDVLEMFQYKY